MQNYPLVFCEQTSSDTFNALFSCVPATALCRWEAWGTFLLKGKAHVLPALHLQGGLCLAVQIQEQTFSPLKGEGGNIRKFPKHSFISNPSAVPRGKHLLIPQMSKPTWFDLSTRGSVQPAAIFAPLAQQAIS